MWIPTFKTYDTYGRINWINLERMSRVQVGYNYSRHEKGITCYQIEFIEDRYGNEVIHIWDRMFGTEEEAQEVFEKLAGIVRSDK